MKTAIVTGGSRGIGFAIANRMAEMGWSVGVIARNQNRLENAAKALQEVMDNSKSGAKTAFAVADVSDYSQVEAAVTDLVNEVGVPSLLVNNAGLVDYEVPVWEADVEQWHEVVIANLIGPFNAERVVIPLMLENGGGTIVNLVTGAGTTEAGIFTAYSSSKSGLIRNVGDIHVAGFDKGLRAFGIAPGTVATDMSLSLDIHKDRTEFTPVEKTLDLVEAAATGQIDDWSGAYLRATHDTVEGLKAAGNVRAENPDARGLRIQTWGPGDPLEPTA